MLTDEGLQKRMEYMQDVAGWKSIIFLPFHLIWQCIMMASVIFVFATSIARATYKIMGDLEINISYICDGLYFIDTVSSILHHSLVNTRKLKNYKSKSWILILIDIISLIPLELIYVSVYISESMSGDYVWEKIWYNLFLNRTLRIYRIYYYFHEYELSVNSLKFGLLFTSLPLYIYNICLIHMATCIYHTVKSEDDLKDFKNNIIMNVMMEEVDMYFLMNLRFNGNFEKYNTINKRICFIVIMVVGYFFSNGISLPRMIFSFQKKHRTFFDFWNRFKRLTVFINNVIEDKAMEKKILNSFRTVWTYGKGDFEPELLQSFPLNMRKNVYADLYWDALRHSDLLHNISRSCKRSLAMKIAGNFYEPGTIFWDMEESKNVFMYLASGILQIMAVENKESPIISFSGGTVLGEAALFYQVRSKAILRVATFAEIHILQAKDFFRVIKDYPKDRKIIFENLKLRLQIARSTQFRQKEISTAILNRNIEEMQDFGAGKFDSVKWIKSQFRKITEMEGVLSKYAKDHIGVGHVSGQELYKLKPVIDHTSIYLPLLNLGEEMEFITDQTCLKTTIPWVIDPNSSFIKHWRFVILCFIVFSSLIYPVFIGWWPVVPRWLRSLSLFISVFHLCDIIIELSTAIKTKDELIARSGPIFRYRFRRLSFYADFISSIPFQFILYEFLTENHFEDTIRRIVILISLVKVYRIIVFLEEWCQTLKGRFSTRVMIKYLIYMFLLTYWTAAFLQICDVQCLFWSCSDDRWYEEELEEYYPGYKNFASVYFVGSYIIGLGNSYDQKVTFPTAIFVILTLTVSEYIKFFWASEFLGSYMSESSQKIKFKNLLKSINTFMTEKNMDGRIMKKVWDTMHFQWIYDCGDYLTQKLAMLEDMPLKLRREVNKATIFKLLRTCDAFNSESDAFIWYLCARSNILVLPSDSVVVTYGTQSMSLYIIYKGYLQVNSFLPKDITAGITHPAFYGPGKIVPIVIALNQLPSGVTARALTDCELISISLEILLTGLMINDCLKDFVDAIKELDLEEFRKSRLVFSKIVTHTKKKDPYYKEPFKKINYFAWIVRHFLMKRTVKGDGKLYIAWEAFRVFTIIVLAVGWPLVLTLPPRKENKYLIYLLLGLESFTWIDFYIKMHVGYYNANGIYISHPLSTFTRYMGTSFLLELLVFIPYFHCIYTVVTNERFFLPQDLAVIHCFARIFALYRVHLFSKSFSDMKSTSVLRPLSFGVILFVVLNCLIVLKICFEVKWTHHLDGTITHSFFPRSWIQAVNIDGVDTFREMYFVMIYCFVMLTFRGDAFLEEYNIESLVLQLFMSIFGIILSFFVLSLIISHKRSSKMNFIVYQYHMKSLRNFLKMEKADDALSMEAIKHFEHEWEKRQGDDLHSVFKRFPNILYEDMMYPIYHEIFSTLPCFHNANDGFFRSLSRTFIEVYFKKKSIISFDKAVHTDIYFILNGWCYVKEGDVILGKGSVMGDIKGKGKMTNNIRAETHVVLLTITSKEFFKILNNYAHTEAAFFDSVKNVNDYIKSNYNIRDLDLQDKTDWKKLRHEIESCKFEMARDERESSMAINKKAKIKIKIGGFINPNSRVAKILLTIFVLDAIATAFIVPLLMCLRMINIKTKILVNFLDAIWFIKILTSFRTAYIASDTGNLVTDKKVIYKNYLKSSDGIFIDILSIIPFEYLYLIIDHYFEDQFSVYEKYCYSFRLLRLFSLSVRVKKEKRKLSLSDWTKWLIIIVREFILYHLLASVNLIVATEDNMYEQEDDKNFTNFLLNVYVWSFLSMFNLYSGCGMNLFRPINLTQIAFKIFTSLIALYERNLLACEVLAVIQAGLFVTSEKLYRMQLMKKFVEVRNISPFLKNSLMGYAYDLLIHYNGDVEPWLLKTAPYYIKVEIMKDLYLKYLNNCYVFEGTPQDFLKQLAARLKRHAYFPRDVITEKGDVDCCMYFVHNGEVASIESDQIYHGLDYEVERFGAGDYFGLEQGLSQSIPQNATYRALTQVDMLILNYYEWKDLRQAFPEVRDIIKSTIKENYKKKYTFS